MREATSPSTLNLSPSCSVQLVCVGGGSGMKERAARNRQVGGGEYHRGRKGQATGLLPPHVLALTPSSRRTQKSSVGTSAGACTRGSELGKSSKSPPLPPPPLPPPPCCCWRLFCCWRLAAACTSRTAGWAASRAAQRELAVVGAGVESAAATCIAALRCSWSALSLVYERDSERRASPARWPIKDELARAELARSCHKPPARHVCHPV